MTELELILLHNQPKIESWFQDKTGSLPPLFYSSIDLRKAGFKTAPVDTNVFPAGFNNLAPSTYPICVKAIKQYLTENHPDVRKILIFPENHTRNHFYLENVAVLTELILKAGYLIDAAEPDLILLNNDLSEGIPSVLQKMTQPIIPPLSMGWFNRSKTVHFTFYEQLATEFANLMGFDPWFIAPLTDMCDHLSFLNLQENPASKQALFDKIDILFKNIQKKYTQYKISEKPFVVIKSDTGTYGMAVMMLQSIEDLNFLNRKQKSKMSIGKGKQTISKMILQEGIPTLETSGSQVCESVIYNIGQTIVGGFNRVHKNKGPIDNLNSPGMHFSPLSEMPYIDTVISRLAQLAARLEIQKGKIL
jgi:glutamate--cysteine ligase